MSVLQKQIFVLSFSGKRRGEEEKRTVPVPEEDSHENLAVEAKTEVAVGAAPLRALVHASVLAEKVRVSRDKEVAERAK